MVDNRDFGFDDLSQSLDLNNLDKEALLPYIKLIDEMFPQPIVTEQKDYSYQTIYDNLESSNNLNRVSDITSQIELLSVFEYVAKLERELIEKKQGIMYKDQKAMLKNSINQFQMQSDMSKMQNEVVMKQVDNINDALASISKMRKSASKK